MTTDPFAEALALYRLQTEAESADVGRVRRLLSAGDPWLRSTALHITGSAVIVHPPTRRVLLRWHARQRAWLQIGGHAEPSETDPLAIATREGKEETGLPDLVPWPDSAIVHVAIVSVPAASHEPAHEHADVRYVLATDTPDLARPEKPEALVRWLSIPDAHGMTTQANLHETLARVEELFDGG